MNSSYKTIYWGLLLMAFNFYLGRLNILPDFLGFILISKGLKEISYISCERSYHISHDFSYFEKAKVISNLMIVISLIQYVANMYIGGSTMNFTTIGIIFFTIGNFINMITLLLIYYILKGIYVEAENRQLIDFMKRINNIWNLKLVVALIMFLLCAFMINGVWFALASIPIGGIVAVIIQIRVALLVKEASREFS